MNIASDLWKYGAADESGYAGYRTGGTRPQLTDKLRSYRAARREVIPSVEHR